MSGVDVLAVMDEAAHAYAECRAEQGRGAVLADDLLEARAAVAGLIEGANAAHMALLGYLPAHRNAVTDAAIAKVGAALARYQGEAAPAETPEQRKAREAQGANDGR